MKDKLKYKVTCNIDAEEKLHMFEDCRDSTDKRINDIAGQIIDLREKAVIDCLVKHGWTPPDNTRLSPLPWRKPEDELPEEDSDKLTEVIFIIENKYHLVFDGNFNAEKFQDDTTDIYYSPENVNWWCYKSELLETLKQ